MEACINKCVLSLFCNIVLDPQCIEYDIAIRQLAVKSHNESSFFSRVRDILELYSLPTAYSIHDNPPTKESWKEQVKLCIHQYIKCLWTQDIEIKSSLKYLNPESVKVGKTHQIYTYVRNSTFDVRRAEIKARLLTGTYTLQSNRARFKQFNADSICPLCKREPESREHYIVTCESLIDVRTPYLVKLRTLFDYISGIDDILKSPELSVQLLLDSSHPRITYSLNNSGVPQGTVLAPSCSSRTLTTCHPKSMPRPVSSLMIVCCTATSRRMGMQSLYKTTSTSYRTGKLTGKCTSTLISVN